MGVTDMIVLLVVGAILLGAVAGITRDALHREQRLRHACPRLRRPRELHETGQDVRTGQWKEPGFRLSRPHRGSP
jgi:hypothetical protein